MENKKEINYWKVAINLFVSLIVTGVLVFLGFKGIVFFMPFVIGWVISMVAGPVVKWLEKRLKIVRKLGSAIIIIIVLGLIMLAIYFGSIRLWAVLKEFIEGFPEYYNSLTAEFAKVGDSLANVLAILPESIVEVWNQLLADLNAFMGKFVSIISEPTVLAASNFAKSIPNILISFVVTVMAAYLFIADRDAVISWSKKVAPLPIQHKMELIVYNFKYAVGGYFKAQLKIMGVVFLILFAAFSLLGIKYAILISILIAFLDFLPFFGTGTAMIPWALFKILAGDYKIALFLALTYVVTQVVRQLIQPKLMADTMGLNPLVTLILLYIGYQIGSVLGMIFAVPIGMILINLYDAGALDYITDDAKLLIQGFLKLRE